MKLTATEQRKKFPIMSILSLLRKGNYQWLIAENFNFRQSFSSSRISNVTIITFPLTKITFKGNNKYART
ncbi:MAG: hypothetical protein WBA93_31235 [Microcoleaceae cyanobacterium]